MQHNKRIELIEDRLTQNDEARKFLVDQLCDIQNQLHIINSITGKLTQIDARIKVLEQKEKK